MKSVFDIDANEKKRASMLKFSEPSLGTSYIPTKKKGLGMFPKLAIFIFITGALVFIIQLSSQSSPTFVSTGSETSVEMVLDTCRAQRQQVEFTHCDKSLMRAPEFWTPVEIDKGRIDMTRSCLVTWKSRLYAFADDVPRAPVVCAYHVGHTSQVCVSRIEDLDFFANLVVTKPSIDPRAYLGRFTSREVWVQRFGSNGQTVEMSDANLVCAPPTVIFLPDDLEVSFVNTRGISVSRRFTSPTDVAPLLFVYLVHTGALFQ